MPPIPTLRSRRGSPALVLAALVLAALASCGALSACAPKAAKTGAPPDAAAAVSAAQAKGVLSGGAITQVSLGMDPSMRALALRHDPFLRRADDWNRPLGWRSLDITQPPDIGFDTTNGPGAVEMNALRPYAKLPIRPMRPFVLNADADDAARALRCLTQAVYYEAAKEPAVGQEAVAQVVLNRVRHPAYPKSVCGVVYQGSARSTGCQFTFTCDGSLKYAPAASYWARAQAVAKKALGGYVDRQVGSATHYHANYVVPWWAPTLVKMTQAGSQIFYRWTGPWGEPAAFTGRYAGHEADLSEALLTSLDPRTQGNLIARTPTPGALFSPEAQGIGGERKVTLAVAGEVRTYTVADPTAARGERTRVLGVLHPARRQPTPDEIRMINDSLAGLESPGVPKAPAEVK